MNIGRGPVYYVNDGSYIVDNLVLVFISSKTTFIITEDKNAMILSISFLWKILCI